MGYFDCALGTSDCPMGETAHPPNYPGVETHHASRR